MEKWDEILQEKLSSYRYDEEPSQEKVDFFFDELKQEKKAGVFANQIWLKLAAIVVLLCGAFAISLQFSKVSVVTQKGMIADVVLPDGSKVSMNAKSKLSYDKILWYLDRDVELEGEAFFDVKKGSVFKVVSNHGSTEVLGTSFNIYAREASYNVKCYAGKVKVNSGDEQRTIIPNQGVNFEYEKSVDSFKFDTSKNDWRNGEFYFSNKTLQYVFKEFTLHYDVEVELLDKVKTMRYSGYFPSSDIEMALKLICDPMGLKFTINDDKTVDVELNPM